MGRPKARLEAPAHVAVLGLTGIGLAAALLLADGTATRTMILHALTMSVLAPLAAAGLNGVGWTAPVPASLLAATAMQGALFLVWHTPGLMGAAMHDGAATLAMHGSLFAAAVIFWLCVYRSAQVHPWSAIAALVVSGKLLCLVSVLMVFAPTPAFHASNADLAAQLADQQAAGLVMLAVCPPVYIAIAVIMAARWLSGEPTTVSDIASGGASAR